MASPAINPWGYDDNGSMSALQADSRGSNPRTSTKPKYWYFITEIYCPVCASTQTYKNRMYDPKPEDWDDRHEYIEQYDYCNVF